MPVSYRFKLPIFVIAQYVNDMSKTVLKSV